MYSICKNGLVNDLLLISDKLSKVLFRLPYQTLFNDMAKSYSLFISNLNLSIKTYKSSNELLLYEKEMRFRIVYGMKFGKAAGYASSMTLYNRFRIEYGMTVWVGSVT